MKCFVVLLLGLAAVHGAELGLLKKFTDGNHRFSTDLYKQVEKENKGNFIFCPLSAEIILALTRMGAKGNTARQLSSGLHLPEDTNEIEQIFKQLTPKLKSTDEYTLNSANRIYLKNHYQIRDDFKSIAQNSFSADVKNIDFDQKESAANEMNSWVSGQTHDKIRDLIDPKKLTSDTRAVLINALYFKGIWVTQFNERSTKSKPFYLNNNDRVEVNMMEVTEYFRYHNNAQLQAKILEMPYQGGEYSMVFVLPHAKDGLAQLESELDAVLSVTEGHIVQVHVQVPKFKSESSMMLTNMLKNLGIKDAFEDYADFSGLSAPGQEALKISDVVQKAVIEVDEKGTVAAAATGVYAINTLSIHQPVIQEFNADHPFIYYIKGPNGVMFIGRYVRD